jgi:hypothetical protein
VFQQKGGFDVVIGNPPYGANIDSLTKVLKKLYPNTTKSHKDSYKIFIELGLIKLVCTNGTVAYILPNTLLRQPRYRDVREFVLKHEVIEVIDLGGNVFDEAVVPTCIIIMRKNSRQIGYIKFNNLSSHSKFVGEILVTSRYEKTENVFAARSDVIATNELTLGMVLDFKDAGINYQRVNVGMGNKGKSDLGQRLLYEGEQDNPEDVMYWKGEDIDAYYVAERTNRWVRVKTIESLRENERVILNKEYFERVPKLIWRQTASVPIVTIDTKGIWFGRSIQAATIKPLYKQYDYKFFVGVLNSKYCSFAFLWFMRNF